MKNAKLALGQFECQLMLMNITIFFAASIAYKEKHFSGTIVVKGKTNIIIPYHVTLVPGGLHLNSSFASFWSNEVVVARNLVVRNTFHHSLVISNVTLAPDAAKYFEVIKTNWNITARC